jgi:pyruvate/2-oxoglutarate dehydrogenase complex dihydrolipoamide dehydrogenase (E3) component
MYKKAALAILILALYTQTQPLLMLRSIMTKATPKNVVVIGGSYVGLNVAESLAKASNDKFRVISSTSSRFRGTRSAQSSTRTKRLYRIRRAGWASKV